MICVQFQYKNIVLRNLNKGNTCPPKIRIKKIGKLLIFDLPLTEKTTANIRNKSFISALALAEIIATLTHIEVSKECSSTSILHY